MEKVSEFKNNSIYKNFTLTSGTRGGYNSVAYTNPQPDIIEISADESTVNQVLNKKSHKKRNLVFVVGSSALALGVGVLVLMRGLPKNTEKYLEKLKKYLEKKLEKSSIKGSDRLSEFLETSLRFVNSAINKAQSINNITSFKDILFKNLMERTKLTSKIHKQITDTFERLSRKTVLSSYFDFLAAFATSLWDPPKFPIGNSPCGAGFISLSFDFSGLPTRVPI